MHVQAQKALAQEAADAAESAQTQLQAQVQQLIEKLNEAGAGKPSLCHDDSSACLRGRGGRSIVLACSHVRG